MPQRRIKQLPADVLADEFGREKASALGRLGRAFEAALAALAEFDAGHSRRSCAAEDRQLRASLVAEQASRCGISWCSARPAGCGTYATSCAITAVPPEVAARMGALPPEPLRSHKPPRRQ
jgi:hypothetical protein